jgi:hypothetical protein
MQTKIAAPSHLFPKWSKYEQDWWMDTFQTLTELLVESHAEEESPRYQLATDAVVEYYIDRIRLAAKLADESTKEMIYRFHRQEPLRTQARMNGEDPRRRKKARSRW